VRRASRSFSILNHFFSPIRIRHAVQFQDPVDHSWFIVGLTLVLAAFLSWRSEWAKTGEGLVQIDFNYLAQIKEGRTEPQALALLRHFIGKRTKLVGELYDISPVVIGFPMLHLDLGDHARAVVNIAPWNRSFNGIDTFPRGAIMTVTGRIRRIDPSSSSAVWLSGCELIDVRLPTAEPSTQK
jgi:hypothetical protein